MSTYPPGGYPSFIPPQHSKPPPPPPHTQPHHAQHVHSQPTAAPDPIASLAHEIHTLRVDIDSRADVNNSTRKWLASNALPLMLALAAGAGAAWAYARDSGATEAVREAAAKATKEQLTTTTTKLEGLTKRSDAEREKLRADVDQLSVFGVASYQHLRDLIIESAAPQQRNRLKRRAEPPTLVKAKAAIDHSTSAGTE